MNLFVKKTCIQHSAVMLLMLLFTVAASAIPAKPGLTKKITLADGTQVVARLVGDEHGHYWLDADGHAYQALDNDVYQSVDLQEVKQRSAVRRKVANQRRVRRLAPNKVGEIGNITGQKKGLIILVNFSNVAFKSANNNALYQRIANEKNFSYGNFVGSMYDYFKAQSEGQFELTFDVVGPVKVSQTQSYYGSNDYNGDDKYPATMVIEALKLADSQVNYADYDWDGDGKVEQVYVVYAGKGEADGGASSTIWPHEWELSAAAQYGDGSGAQTLDDVTINTYACGGELNGQTGTIAGIGTMCHEFSHCLGYPDFYDTDYSGGQGMFEWDLMDSGSYNGDGYRPSGYTSYERWVAGWETPITLEATQSVTNMAALQNGGDSYIIYNKGNNNEYFLLENRQKVGWDADIPGAGLLILHVDYSESAWANNTPNDTPSHQRMTWVAADNEYQYTTYQGTKYYTTEGAANDPFPYGSVNAFNKSTTPAAKFFNKNSDNTYYMDSSVENITQNSNGTISFNFVGTSNVATPSFSPAGGRYENAQSVTISCTTTGATIHYTLDGTTPTASSAVYSSPLTISETTTVKAIAVKNGEQSAVASAKYTIGATLFYEGLTGYSANNDGSTELATYSSYLDYSGWATLSKVYAGGTNNTYENGGCLKFGSGSASGSMTTGSISLTGSGTLTFYLKKYGSDTGILNVTVTGATADVTQFTPSADWALCTVNLTNATGNVTITLATSSKRAYVDEIMLTSISTPVEKEDVTMSFNPESVEVTLGNTWTQPTLTIEPAGLAVTYSSSDADVATVNAETGEVTIVGEGETTITASFAGNDNFNSGTASYTLTVTGGSTPVGSGYYALVTDASTLAEGDKILIAYVNEDEENQWVLSTTQQTNNRAATSDVTLNDDGTLTPGQKAQIITLEKDGNNFLFNVGNGYLYAASKTKNYLRTETEADNNAKAAISISGGSATILFQGANTRNLMRYNPNNGTPIFSCYSSTSTTGFAPQIYREIIVPETVILDETSETAPTAATNVTVILNRTLLGKDNVESGHAWNTICFPFTLSSSQIQEVFGEGTVVKQLAGVTMNGERASLSFEAVDDIEANKPYIMQVAEGGSQYTLEGIDIEPSDELTVTVGGIEFIGNYTYDATAPKIPAGDYYLLNDEFKKSANGTKLKGFRAYFHVNATAGIKSLGFEEGEATGIAEIGNSDLRLATDAEVFDLAGRRVARPSKGLYIINGKKVFVK